MNIFIEGRKYICPLCNEIVFGENIKTHMIRIHAISDDITDEQFEERFLLYTFPL